ncbi:hypothetical protein AB9F39_37870, partial [Rhizobium leguminosarum]
RKSRRGRELGNRPLLKTKQQQGGISRLPMPVEWKGIRFCIDLLEILKAFGGSWGGVSCIAAFQTMLERADV